MSCTEAHQMLWAEALPSFVSIHLCRNEAMHTRLTDIYCICKINQCMATTAIYTSLFSSHSLPLLNVGAVYTFNCEQASFEMYCLSHKATLRDCNTSVTWSANPNMLIHIQNRGSLPRQSITSGANSWAYKAHGILFKIDKMFRPQQGLPQLHKTEHHL